jgi:hypothetical protein
LCPVNRNSLSCELRIIFLDKAWWGESFAAERKEQVASCRRRYDFVLNMNRDAWNACMAGHKCWGRRDPLMKTTVCQDGGVAVDPIGLYPPPSFAKESSGKLGRCRDVLETNIEAVA